MNTAKIEGVSFQDGMAELVRAPNFTEVTDAKTVVCSSAVEPELEPKPEQSEQHFFARSGAGADIFSSAGVGAGAGAGKKAVGSGFEIKIKYKFVSNRN